MPTTDLLLFGFLMVVAFGGVVWFLKLANEED